LNIQNQLSPSSNALSPGGRIVVRGKDLAEGAQDGSRFTPEQLTWLNKIKDDVQGSANVVGGRTPGTTKSPKMPK